MRSCAETDTDLWSDEVLLDPYPVYAQLRELGPVVYMTAHNAYCATRYHEVREVLQDWETFSSAKGVGLMPERIERHVGGILTTDPPQHTALRAVLNTQLVARQLEPHHDFITAEAEQLVSELVPLGAFDVVGDLAHPYSVKIVADLVGFPEDGRDRFIDRADASFNTFGPDNELLRSSMEAYRDLGAYCHGVASPGQLAPDRWGTQILEAGERGDVRTSDCIGLLVAYAWAGMDTTLNGITCALKLLAENPEQWDLLRDNRTLIGGAINEALRIDPPVHRFTRCTTKETELGGVTLPADARVVVLFGAANRDPRRFDNPDRFDVTRDHPTGHLSFGRGIHRCVGASLAQLEIHAVLTALLDRVEHISVTNVRPHRNNALHGVEELHVSVGTV